MRFNVAGSELLLENSFCYSGAEPTREAEKMIPRGMASPPTVSSHEENYTDSFFTVFKMFHMSHHDLFVD